MSGARAAWDRHIRTGNRTSMVTAKHALREPTRPPTKGKISHDNARESSARRFIIHSAGISAAAALQSNPQRRFLMEARPCARLPPKTAPAFPIKTGDLESRSCFLMGGL